MFEIIKSLVTRQELRNVSTITDEEPTFDAHILSLRLAESYIKNRTILDVGCWTGQFVNHFVDKAKSITGIDPESQAIKLAKINCPQGSFSVGDARKLKLKDKSFDVATFLDVIEHVPKGTELKCLREINRVLKPNGILIMCTPFKHPFSTYLDPMYWVFGHRHYSEEKLRELLLRAGFTTSTVLITGTLWRTLYFDISMVVKHLFKRKLEVPEYIKKKILNDYQPGGFMSIHIIARKVI